MIYSVVHALVIGAYEDAYHYVKPNDLKLLSEQKEYAKLHTNPDPLTEDSQGYLISRTRFSRQFDKKQSTEKNYVITAKKSELNHLIYVRHWHSVL